MSDNNAQTMTRKALIERLRAQSAAHLYMAETDSAALLDEAIAALSSAAPAAGEAALTELLEDTRDTLVKVLLKIRRDAPDLSGKLMGHADNVVARVDAFLDAAPPTP